MDFCGACDAACVGCEREDEPLFGGPDASPCFGGLHEPDAGAAPKGGPLFVHQNSKIHRLATMESGARQPTGMGTDASMWIHFLTASFGVPAEM